MKFQDRYDRLLDMTEEAFVVKADRAIEMAEEDIRNRYIDEMTVEDGIGTAEINVSNEQDEVTHIIFIFYRKCDACDDIHFRSMVLPVMDVKPLEDDIAFETKQLDVDSVVLRGQGGEA